MGTAFFSLFLIVLVAFLSPLLSWTVPRRIVPETVLLILGGLLIGPSGLGLAHATVSIEFLRELGMAFLFLMAGYEIDVNELRGAGGRHALAGWVGSLLLAFGTVAVVGVHGGVLSANGIAIAIAMTSTAIGTILPILRERWLLQTSVGAAILNHGAVGEVAPIIMMALLLGSRATWKSVLILLGFLAITVLIVRFTDQVRRLGKRLVEAIHLGGTTTAQTTIRITVLLLVGLCTLAEVFQLDVVLGAFAAGFILRYAVPDGSRELEEKLDGLAYGFFVPIFFVTSGMAIELDISGDMLSLVGSFLIALVVVRGVPVWMVSRLERRHDGSRAYSLRQSTQIAVYSTTALPIIVAVTQVAVAGNAMSSSVASALVLAGAVSVLVMPALGLLLASPADHAPVVEAMAVPQGPQDAAGHEVLSAEITPGHDELPTPEGGVGLYVSEPRKPAGLETPGQGAEKAGHAAASRESKGEARSGAAPSVRGERTGVFRRGGFGGRAETGGATGAAGRVGAEGRAGAAGHPGEPGSERTVGFTGHTLTQAEARYLAERLAQLEADRIHWRQQMRRQRRLDLEESAQKRALRRALVRERRREEREQVKELRKEAARLRLLKRTREQHDDAAGGSADHGGSGEQR